MLLSRAAESIYWIGRHIERAECTARLEATQANLSFDMPPGRELPTGPLLMEGVVPLAGSDDEIVVATEAQVVVALATRVDDPSSIAASLAAARDNMRSSRQRFPREAWETLNRLYFCAHDESPQAHQTAKRYCYLQHLIVESQKLTGILHGTMSRDSAYAFFMLGQNLERAQATVQVINAGADLLARQRGETEPFDDVRWMHLLKSLAAFQMYRRGTPASASGLPALQFLMNDSRFPRSIAFCLDEVAHRLKTIPNSHCPLDECHHAMGLAAGAGTDALGRTDIHFRIDQLQQSLDAVHDAVSDTWFEAA